MFKSITASPYKPRLLVHRLAPPQAVPRQHDHPDLFTDHTPAARKMCSPMEIDEPPTGMKDVPTELLHMICGYLEPVDVKAFRLVNKTFAEIGATGYLLPSLSVRLSPSSFQQVEAIAEHPTISRYARELVLHGQNYTFPSRHWRFVTWVLREYMIELIEEGDDKFLRQNRDAIGHILYKHVEANPMEISRIYPYIGGVFTMNYFRPLIKQHEEAVSWQNKMWDEELDLAIVSKAIKAMPLLRSITLAAETSRKDKSWGGMFGGMKTLNSPGLAAGVRQLGTLLIACRNAGTKFTSMELNCLSWRFFEHLQKHDGLQLFRSAASCLTSFSLDLATFTLQDGVYENVEAVECRLFLGGGVLGQLLRDMTNLQHLQLSADSTVKCHRHDNLWIRLEDTTRGFVWPHLTSLTLKQIATQEESLVLSLGNHMPTLKELHLGSLLLSSGNWISAFRRIRKLILQHDLESLTISGCHYEQDSLGGSWYRFVTEYTSEERPCGADCTPYTHNRKLEHYLMHGGQYPTGWRKSLLFADFDGDF
ncbi:uncharacterized protein BDZ99DRAFT_251372 [Mytilinidion resinicola]|uniref:F-box domain-containing protein n=1 Tax=Mytilinidion resinicola TaxID=574789 RepID=A0A6A6YW80_9PEZI|nr:uncharacterized protein BDZ99DRAFT_251372 [Mytilinidion resinicola]KAF2813202.1 hypothetical protein BDZ99DRAFT_251372 [Mytilinidion resinicola]